MQQLGIGSTVNCHSNAEQLLTRSGNCDPNTDGRHLRTEKVQHPLSDTRNVVEQGARRVYGFDNSTGEKNRNEIPLSHVLTACNQRIAPKRDARTPRVFLEKLDAAKLQALMNCGRKHELERRGKCRKTRARVGPLCFKVGRKHVSKMDQNTSNKLNGNLLLELSRVKKDHPEVTKVLPNPKTESSIEAGYFNVPVWNGEVLPTDGSPDKLKDLSTLLEMKSRSTVEISESESLSVSPVKSPEVARRSIEVGRLEVEPHLPLLACAAPCDVYLACQVSSCQQQTLDGTILIF